MKFETLAIHAGAAPDESTAALVPPIHLSTTFEHAPDGSALHGFTYIRDGNPTQGRLEEALAAIDSAAAALVFASGMAASAALFQSLPGGAHVLIPADAYYGVRALASEYFPRWNLEHDFVAMDDIDAVRAAMRDTTRAIWAESPSNPLMTICDLGALAAIAHEGGAILVVDGTFATPALQRPLELGADAVMHSTTKYLGGHSDVQGGSLAFRERGALFDAVAHTRKLVGGVASPFNCWLVLRGIRSLAARMRVHSANALAIAEFLAAHPAVASVHYPGLATHPGHEIAVRQMSDFGGMLSFRVRAGRDAAIAVTRKTKLFVCATSLGGVESLIEHRASIEGASSTTSPDLLRVSVGLEHPDDLIDDLRQALG
ncbi:MAG TPA: aminotransferase class I/II-fold pyridoxal phosphate-dependent enzyme [Thermoanaerobaculia bacterium]|nr:aminotransferase class I/II-fold pyridoxal phosphate-dependent enzyme [Thermoanaerobaculia bacterium]